MGEYVAYRIASGSSTGIYLLNYRLVLYQHFLGWGNLEYYNQDYIPNFHLV